MRRRGHPGLEQIVEFSELVDPCVLLDDAPSPNFRTGIAQCSEDAMETGGLVGCSRQFEFDGIDLYGIGVGQVRAAVNETPFRVSGGRLLEHKSATVVGALAPGRVI